MAQGLLSDHLQYVSKVPCSCISCHVMSRTHGHPSRGYPIHNDVLHPQRHSSHPNTCIQTCFSHIASNLMPSFPVPPCSCTPTQNLQQWMTPSNSCSCCRHPISRCHHRTPFPSHDNHSHHPPHYAQAFSPPPLVHASWESTRETNLTQDISHMSTSPEYFTELEHHHRHFHRRHRHTPYAQQTCPPTRHNHMHNLEQELHNLAWRHYQRHYAREISYPSFRPHEEQLITFYRTPEVEHRHPFVPPLFTMADTRRDTRDYDWVAGNSQPNNETSGLKQQELDQLPSYYVTKKTLEEFTESDRCVVCMSEYEVEDNLRILPCAHEFHSNCVDKWLWTNPTCPICRATVKAP